MDDGLEDQDSNMDGAETEEETIAPDSETPEGSEKESFDPVFVQKRLKQQKRAHEREKHVLNSRIDDLEARLNHMANMNPNPQDDHDQSEDPMRKAFSLMQQFKQEQEKEEAQKQHAHVMSEKNEELENHLNQMSDKYDDFDEIVKGRRTPYSSHMASIAFALPKSGPGSAGEVLYKLGHPKNRAELDRINKLHPLDQQSEMIKLSHALITGDSGKQTSKTAFNPMEELRSKPSASDEITDKSSFEDIMKSMKAGKKAGW